MSVGGLSSADDARWLREAVGAVGVVVLDVFADHGLQMAAAEDDHPVEALVPHGADHALADGVGPGCPDGGP
jgi:hypothetical protein